MQNYPPAKTVFENLAFVLTIPKWYNTWVLQIFFVNIFFLNWKKIFWKIFLTKYLQKIFAIPKCYTILESWEQMPQHGFDKNLIRRIFFFNIQRGDPLDFQKRFLQCRGVIFQKKKFCVFGSLSNMSKNGLRMVVCLNFDITHLSPPSNCNQWTHCWYLPLLFKRSRHVMHYLSIVNMVYSLNMFLMILLKVKIFSVLILNWTARLVDM